MAKLAHTPSAPADAEIGDHLKEFNRRVDSTPPGGCPLTTQLSHLQTSSLQSCGKCVPCRDGLPQLAKLLQQVVECKAPEGTLENMNTLAEMIRDTSDCAIGYKAAKTFLEGTDTFADEYKSHLAKHSCAASVGQTVPCETTCPAHVNIPAYIALAGQGDYAGAVNMIRKDNPFPTACAFVCEYPCEKRCRRRLIDAPVNIRGIKRFAVDQMNVDQVATPAANASTGRSIAVIGGGPSGLTCAYFLGLMGHHVVIFEKRKHLGGMLRYGIPSYRLPRERLDQDINSIIASSDIEVKLGVDIARAEMEEIAETFDAVYVAIGAQKGNALDIENGDAKGVMSAVEMLRQLGDDELPDFTGKKVVVVGGGNVAMDCARTSIRAGAEETSIVYRRRKDDMTALSAEIESAIAEGVEMLMLESPVSIEVDAEGNCTALITQPQMISTVKQGRPMPKDADKPQSRIEADIILVAIGQAIDFDPFCEFGMISVRGRLRANKNLEADSFQNIFTGGDCHTGPATAIRAIGAGKVAARNIDEYLGYHHSLDCGVAVPTPLSNDRTPKGRVELMERPARERKLDFDFVENSMSAEEAAQECSRCLRCDHFGSGAVERGRIQYA